MSDKMTAEQAITELTAFHVNSESGLHLLSVIRKALSAPKVPVGWHNAYEVLGWAHAFFCVSFDDGIDPRTIEVGEIVNKMQRQLLTAAPSPAIPRPHDDLLGYEKAAPAPAEPTIAEIFERLGRETKIDVAKVMAMVDARYDAPAPADSELASLRERVKELEHYNVGLANESHARYSALNKIQAIADGYVSEGGLPVMVVVQTICKQALAGGSQ